MTQTTEEEFIERYFDAFNRHDIDEVMACFHDQPVIVGMDGTRLEGREAVRRYYEDQFFHFPDGRCDLRSVAGHDGRGMAESLFLGTRPRDGRVIRALGVEVIEFVDCKIRELRDYHRLVE